MSNRRRLLLIASGITALVVSLGVIVVLRVNNIGPFYDAGIAQCKVIRHNQQNLKAAAQKNGYDYPTARKVFTDSRYADIRDAGTKFVDNAKQLGDVPMNSDGSPSGEFLDRGKQMVQSFNALSKACSNHGVAVKPLP